MVRCEDRELGHAARGVELDGRGELLAAVLGRTHEAGVLDLLGQIDLEPIGRILARDIGLDYLGRPILDRRAMRAPAIE